MVFHDSEPVLMLVFVPVLGLVSDSDLPVLLQALRLHHLLQSVRTQHPYQIMQADHL
mgnify:CR=1 FL=1